MGLKNKSTRDDLLPVDILETCSIVLTEGKEILMKSSRWEPGKADPQPNVVESRLVEIVNSRVNSNQ